MLQHLISLRILSTDIAKSFNTGRVIGSRWIKCHQLSNSLREPKDDNEIIKILREMQQFHPNLVFCHAMGISEKRVLK